MTYQYANEQGFECAFQGSRSNVESELIRLDDASARIRNDIVAYANELATLQSELRAVEQQRNDLAASLSR